MAHIYGARYENLNRNLGGGGQGEVLRVRDTRDPTGKEYALKRLKRAERCQRFRAEIEALQTIIHPNVIKILNHSGDPSPGEANHKYWFVMPVAAGNLEDRVGLYKGDLDGVLNVALQLTAALEAAHGRGIVHRDVKPANILFPRMDHEVWLSDFGICHIASTKDRLTPDGEIVGPRGFTAPELEPGGAVPITSAADLYSLGKVIYYMLSGGGYVAREHLDGAAYAAHFAKGERYGLLRTLLSRMITTIDRRIATAAEVRTQLLYIQTWEKHARDLALDAHTLAMIDTVQQGAIQQRDIKARNQAIRQTEDRLVEEVSSGIVDWLKGEIDKTAALMGKSGTHEISVSKTTFNRDRNFGFQLSPSHGYRAVQDCEIALINATDTFKNKSVLKFTVFEGLNIRFQHGKNEAPLKPVDPELAVAPYILDYPPPKYNKTAIHGFLKSNVAMARLRQGTQRAGRSVVYNSEPVIAKTFIGHQINLVVMLKASEWPAKIDEIRDLFNESIRTLIEFSNGDFRAAGP